VARRGGVTELTTGTKLFVSGVWRLATEGRLARRHRQRCILQQPERTEMLYLQPPRDISILPGAVSLDIGAASLTLTLCFQLSADRD
jgi:hypothetical protein